MARPFATPTTTAAAASCAKLDARGSRTKATAESAAAGPAAHFRPNLSEMIPVGAIIANVATPAMVKTAPVSDAEYCSSPCA